MVIFSWHNGQVPEEIPITQVHGILFTADGRILLRIVDSKYYLTGGRPEYYDKNLRDTLIREVYEEINTTIKSIELIGYQLVTEDNGNKHAQIRMVALIKEIGKSREDLDSGDIYKRILVPVDEAASLLSWGDVGTKQINEAIKIAKTKYNIKEFNLVKENV